MGYLDYTDDFIFFPRQENSQEYFNICDFKSLPKRTDTICHCFNHDRQLFYKDIFYFDPVEHFWFCGVCPHFYPTLHVEDISLTDLYLLTLVVIYL